MHIRVCVCVCVCVFVCMYAYVPRNAQLSGCMWMQVYRQDSFGRDIIQGYGSMLVPTVAGRYTRYVRMFAPVSSSPFQSMLVWLTGNKPEVRQLCCASLIPYLFAVSRLGCHVG